LFPAVSILTRQRSLIALHDAAGRGSDVKNRNLTLAAALIGAAWLATAVFAPVRADAGAPGATSAAAPTSTAATSTTAPRAAETPKSASGDVARPSPAAGATPTRAVDGQFIQVTGRLIHTWYESPGLRVIMVIDGFTVMTHSEQLTARDGCIWFDEAAAKKTGKVTLGVYSETGVEYRHAGKIEKFDSVYLVMESPGEIDMHSDESLRGRADSTELFLRAKKLRKEYLETGLRESPTGVATTATGTRVQPPGVREAGIPQEIDIVAQDDVRKVSFTSRVEDGVRISVWTGGVYLIRTDPNPDKIMEMAADNIVIWTPEDAMTPTGRAAGGATSTAAAPSPAAPGSTATGSAAEVSAVPGAPVPQIGAENPRRVAAEAYMEGHVRLIQGHRTLTCNQLYYDFRRERALALDTRIKMFDPVRNIPLYMHAKEVRQLAEGVFVGTDAWMTTCSFSEPHYDIGASKIQVEDLTPRADETADKVQYRRIRFLGQDVATRIAEHPVAWWPSMAGDFTESPTALKKVSVQNQSSRGTGVVTQWRLFQLLGIEKPPEGFENTNLNLDYWSKRGPLIGADGKYQRETFYGEFNTYYLHDVGTDRVNGQDVNPSTENRGRFTWRDRHYLPDNWEMTLELSKISDSNLLNEWNHRESTEGKTQETLLYLKKQEADQALTILMTPKINSFQTLTEYYPQVEYRMIGHSLAENTLTYFQDSQVAIARYKPGSQPMLGDVAIFNPNIPASDTTLIADTIHELDLPLKLTPVNIVPFAEGRLSYFSDTLKNGTGGDGRYAARGGARAATQAWRVYDNVESDFWDLHRLRHVNIFDVSASAATVNVPSRDLFPFDPAEAGTMLVDGVDSTDVAEVGWRQRFQTMRGLPGKQQSVDFLTTDLEMTWYSNADKQPPALTPDGKQAFNHMELRTDWKATDSATVWTDTNYNFSENELDFFTIATTITHTPRLTYTIGHQVLPDAHSSISFVGMDYTINEKWRVSFLQQYDWARGQNARSSIVLARRMDCWIMRLRFEFDPGRNDTFAGIEFQPVGVPEVRIGH